MQLTIGRREFIRKNVAAGIGLAMAPGIIRQVSLNEQKINLGFIGVGGRGTSLLRLALDSGDVNVRAICDIKELAAKKAQNLVTEAGLPEPALYTSGEESFRELVTRDDLDGVIIATPWIWHAPMAVAAMKQGLYAGVEVPAAITVEECWDLVKTSEETGMPCMILENVCYRRDIMAVLNMVRQGLFGELIHCQCGYQHDLRGIKFNPGVEFGPGANGEAEWRTQHSIFRNGDVYPTHGVGPVATYLDINRGNRFVSLTSVATKSRGLHNYVVETAGENHPHADIHFKLGDIVTTLIQCANGETVMVSHDTNLPRPYSLGFRVQGTKGIWMDDGSHIYFEGHGEPHTWEDAEAWLNEYDHPLWKRYENLAEGAGHGGMDFFVVHAFIESVKRKVNTPLDVYDAAAWSVISPLSEQSIAEGGAPQAFPDFTGGKWIVRRPSFGSDDESI
jgi:predicted dehydrogenase